MKFCMVAGLQQVGSNLSNWLSAFGAVRGRNLTFPIHLAIFPLIWPNQCQRVNFAQDAIEDFDAKYVKRRVFTQGPFQGHIIKR